MKVISDVCLLNYNTGSYNGECIVELEENETIQDVINEYIKKDRPFWEEHYCSPRQEGNRVYMETYVEPLD